MKTYKESDKVCRCCGKEKEFFMDSPLCEECYRRIRTANVWDEKFKRIIYYVEHREEIKQKRKEYRLTHKEQAAESKKKYIANNREKWNAYQRQYQKRKREEMKAKLARLAELEQKCKEQGL